MRFFATFLWLILTTSAQARFAEAADAAGFVYEPRQDIYVAKINALQRIAGYHSIFDFFAPLGSIVIDTEPVFFEYQGTKYMMELWKGQYYGATGSEIGIYQWNGVAWEVVKNEDMLFISYRLKSKNETVFEHHGIHWWHAGFKPGLFSAPEDLLMENIFIDFKTKAARDAFLKGLYDLGYDKNKDDIDAPLEDSTIIFSFHKPKSPQHTPPWIRKYLQLQNRYVTQKYNDDKKRVGGTDNSPETIDKILAPQTP